MTKENKDDTKLNEYLGLMTAPSKMKTWRDGEMPMLQLQEQEKDALGGEEAATVKPPNIQQHVHDALSRKSDEQHDTLGTYVEPMQVDGEPNVMATDGATAPTGTSDLDWMRSRTSRLLGLVDDDDDEGDQESGPVRDQSPSVASDAAPEVKDAETAVNDNREAQETAEGAAANATVAPGSGSEQEHTSADIVAIQASGRLFLRNLAYTVTEEDLRSCFSPFGTLTEVS